MSLYLRWIVACTAGELVGIGVATSAALAINALIGEPRSLGSRLLTLATFAAVGAVEGAALAGFQWRVLRTRLPRLRAAEWIGVTVGLAVAGWMVGMTPSLFMSHEPTAAQEEPGLMLVLLMAAMAGAGAGLCFGAAHPTSPRRARRPLDLDPRAGMGARHDGDLSWRVVAND